MLKFVNDIRVAQKLPAAIIFIGVSIASIVAVMSYNGAKSSLLEQSEANLVANVEVKYTALDNWLGGIRDDIIIQSTNPSVVLATQAFAEAWQDLGTDQTNYLQTWYIADNPNPIGAKENLDAASDGSSYSAVHATYHGYFRELLRRNEYYDVFLFDRDGNLIYSVFKELDFATNLVTGKWASTDLGEAFRAAAANAGSSEPSFFDFRPYGPSADAPASFISIPIETQAGEFVGVLAYQMPVGRLNALMGDRGGLGDTGQAYIVATDDRFRSDLPLTDADDILTESAVIKDFSVLPAGQTHLMVGEGLSGQKVVRASRQMNFMGTRWTFSAEQDYRELVAPARELRNALIVQILIGALFIGIISFFMSRYFTRPLSRLTEAIEHISDNRLEAEVPETDRRDEIGAIAKSLDRLKVAQVKSKAMERDQEQVVSHLSQALADLAAGDLTSRIESEMPEEYETLKASYNGTVDALAGSFRAVSEDARKVRSSSTLISQSADDLSRRTEGQAATLEETAAAIEELTASVASTAEGAKQADTLARSTHDEAEASREIMDQAVTSIQGIEVSTGQISQIVDMINDIAFQTNLLALNAGVEAARAGDAGRGFAVVASEVRVLAQRCAESADEIARLVQKSKTDVGSGVKSVTQAVSAIRGVLESIHEISSAVSNISVATQEQSSGLSEINSAVSQLDSVTQQNAVMVEETKAASRSLNADSDRLEEQVSRFRFSSDAPVATPISAPVASSTTATVQNPVHQQQARLRKTASALTPAADVADDWIEF